MSAGRIVVPLIAINAIGAVALVVLLSGDDEPTAPEPSAGAAGAEPANADESAPTAGVARVPDIESSAAHPLPDTPDELPIAEEPTDVRDIFERQIPQRVLAASSHCYRGEPGRDEALELTYKVTYRDGLGKTSDITVVSSDFDARLEGCIKTVLASMTWHDDVPDTDKPMTSLITLLALRKNKSTD